MIDEPKKPFSGFLVRAITPHSHFLVWTKVTGGQDVHYLAVSLDNGPRADTEQLVLFIGNYNKTMYSFDTALNKQSSLLQDSRNYFNVFRLAITIHRNCC